MEISCNTLNLFNQLLNSIKKDYEKQYQVKITKLDPDLSQYTILEDLMDSIYNYINENADLN